MSALDVLTELHRRGCRVLAIGERLKVWPGTEPLTDELRQAIRETKPALLDLLRTPSHPCSHCGRFLFPKPTVCFWCRREPGQEAA